MGDEAARARLSRLIEEQDCVVARGQVLDCGLGSSFVRRQLRRESWVSVYPGVYRTHTGPPSWTQRAWAAVLDAAPAALSHGSALRIAARNPNGGPTGELIHLAVPAGVHRTPRPGVVVHHRSTFDDDVRTHLQPPRVRFDEAVLDVAADSVDAVETVAVFADAVGDRRTTAVRLLDAARRRSRLRHRALIVAVLADVRDGTCSALEHVYLTRVEKAHALPTPIRQSPTRTRRRGFRDLEYPDLGVAIELDGRLFHDSAADRDRDMERDLDAAVESDLTTSRLGWGQAAVRPCVTATKLARLLAARGWSGSPHPCARPDCALRT